MGLLAAKKRPSKPRELEGAPEEPSASRGRRHSPAVPPHRLPAPAGSQREATPSLERGSAGGDSPGPKRAREPARSPRWAARLLAELLPGWARRGWGRGQGSRSREWALGPQSNASCPHPVSMHFGSLSRQQDSIKDTAIPGLLLCGGGQTTPHCTGHTGCGAQTATLPWCSPAPCLTTPSGTF